MRAPFPVATAVVLLASGAPCLAAGATADGAKAIAASYAAWFTPAVVDKGIVAVAPQGDDYLVTWDLQKLIDLADPAPDVIKIDKFAYTLTPKGDDAWSVKADHFPSVSFDVSTDKGKMKGTIDLSGFRVDTTYDGKAQQFLSSVIAATLVTGKFHFDDPSNAGGDVDLNENGIAAEFKGGKATSGADYSFSQTMKSVTETISAPADPKSKTPVKMTFTMGGVTSDGTVTALRSKEIGDLWKLAAASGPDAGPPPDLKDRITAMLPLWNDFRVKAEVKDMAFDADIPATPVHVEMKSLSEVVALTGFTPHAAAEFGMTIADFSAKVAMLPPWSNSIQPLSFDFDVKLAVDGMDEAARVALADPQFFEKSGPTDETKAKVQEILMKGHPHVVIAPGRFKTPTLDLTYEGDVAVTGETPTGHFTVTAGGLDKTQALIQEIGKDAPEAQQVMMGFALVKGLASTGADGRLTWKIELGANGAVTINGQPMPGASP
jgi:hypothetical protein